MRLFVALDLSDAVRQRLGNFIGDLRSLAPKVRWVEVASLHVTLKFIGEQPESRLPEFEAALARIGSKQFELMFRGCGFFPNLKAARVFWVGIEAGSELAKLASDIDTGLAEVGVEQERRSFNPHITLARARGGSGAPGRRRTDLPNSDFAVLQERLASLQGAEFGAMMAREFFLYRSQLSSRGSIYTKLARFPLTGGN
jgi:RNA 2',3'-cyclic 3'-phosphodiesterase